MLNLFGQILDNEKRKSLLLDSIRLEKTNSVNIVRKVIFVVTSLLNDRSERKNFKFLLTDGAAYCLKVGKILKDEYSDLKHIICACHNLHLVAEEVRKNSNLANSFISDLKKPNKKQVQPDDLL